MKAYLRDASVWGKAKGEPNHELRWHRIDGSFRCRPAGCLRQSVSLHSAHKRYSVCVAQDEQGRKPGVARIEGNLSSGFAQFPGGLGGPSEVVIEACWGWGKVHDVLEEVAGVVVGNPFKTRLIAESQIKNRPDRRPAHVPDRLSPAQRERRLHQRTTRKTFPGRSACRLTSAPPKGAASRVRLEGRGFNR